jgi:hypothetical protein
MINNSRPQLGEQFVSDSIPVGFPWRLFIFSLTLFVFSIFVFFGLKFGYTAYINGRAEEVDRKIENLASQVTREDQQSFIGFYSQLVNLEKVLGRHGFSANVFGFLEKNTLGGVYYSEAKFSAAENSFELNGVASSNETLVGQLAVFDAREEVRGVRLNRMNAESSGNVIFGITIFFEEGFSQKPAV